MQTQTTIAPPKLPVPEKPPHILEQERKLELLKKARVIKEKMASRRQELNGLNPSKQYMWVNIREDRQIFFQALGWEVCRDEKVESPFKQKADNTHRRADVILYEIDRDLYEALHAADVLRGIENIEAAEDGFKLNLMRAGVQTFKPPVK